MTNSIDEEIGRELRLQYEALLNRVEDQAVDIAYLQYQISQLKEENSRLKWAIREQD